MDRFGAGRPRRFDDRVHVKIAVGGRRRPDPHGFVGHLHMQRARVGVRMDRDRGNAHAPRGCDDAAGDLGAIGDEQAGDHAALLPPCGGESNSGVLAERSEGQVPGIAREGEPSTRICNRQNMPCNAVRVLHDLVIPEPQHAIAGTFKMAVTNPVLCRFRVLTAIDFDNQTFVMAHEINNVGTHRLLSFELQSTKSSAAQHLPEPVFRRRRIGPHGACECQSAFLVWS